MNRSKLQICTEILCNLASNGPMNLINLSEKVTIKKTHLIKHLKLLQKSSLIVKENFGKNKVFFTITERGLAVLRMFKPIFADKNTTDTVDFTGMIFPL